MAEFLTNNNKSALIKFFLFFTTKVLHLYMSFEKVKLLDVSICNRIFNQKALDISRNIQII